MQHSTIIILCLCAASIVHAVQYEVTDQVYFDVEHDDKPLGRITFGLFGKIAPKTVKNFIDIATEGINGRTYAGTKFHRVISRFMIQGGDIVTNNGSGSISIYGKYFEDETFEVKHSGPGFISMANAGKDTNGCQFFITTVATPWLDGHHTIFGKVVEGQDVVHKIEHVKTDPDDRPLEVVFVTKCGLVETPTPFFVSDQPYE